MQEKEPLNRMVPFLFFCYSYFVIYSTTDTYVPTRSARLCVNAV